MTKELETILASCRTICQHPYDNEVVLDTTYNGHRIYKYERSLAAVVIDNQVINMGVINERYPNGSCTFNVHQVDMTGLQYVRYLLTGLLPIMVTCPQCGARFSVFPDDVDLDEFGYLTWCDDCDSSFDVDIPQEWADVLGTDEPGTSSYDEMKNNQDLVAICVYKDSTGRYSDEECNQDNTVDLQFPVRVLWAWYNNMMDRPCNPDEFWWWFEEQSTADDTDGLVQFAEKYYDYHVEFPGTTIPEPGNDTGAMVEYTDGSESWEDVHYTVSYEGKAFSTDQGTVNYQHYNSWEKAHAMFEYCEAKDLDPYLHDNHYGVYLHNGEWY